MNASLLVAALSGFVIACSGSAAMAGAFGVEQGASIDSLPGSAKSITSTGVLQRHTVTLVPLPHSEFESYIVTSTPQTGICRIVGIGADHDDDLTGADIRKTYEALRKVLTAKYGAHKDFDFLHAGSSYEGPAQFSEALNEDEYTLSTYWDAEEHSKLPRDLSEVALNVQSVSATSTYVTLSYSFANFAACTALQKAADNDGL